MSSNYTRWGVAALVTVSLAGQAVAADNITVFAAASLTNAMQDIASQYQKEKGVTVVSSFAS
ncbi:MAG TPA: molybdate ABC transporter substrate-binding protein, partial [Pantoea sp.]|nr:molybdate ABC transporter substrate-binding protein [Pantoea sp.]